MHRWYFIFILLLILVGCTSSFTETTTTSNETTSVDSSLTTSTTQQSTTTSSYSTTTTTIPPLETTTLTTKRTTTTLKRKIPFTNVTGNADQAEVYLYLRDYKGLKSVFQQVEVDLMHNLVTVNFTIKDPEYVHHFYYITFSSPYRKGPSLLQTVVQDNAVVEHSITFDIISNDGMYELLVFKQGRGTGRTSYNTIQADLSLQITIPRFEQLKPIRDFSLDAIKYNTLFRDPSISLEKYNSAFISFQIQDAHRSIQSIQWEIVYYKDQTLMTSGTAIADSARDDLGRLDQTLIIPNLVRGELVCIRIYASGDNGIWAYQNYLLGERCQSITHVWTAKTYDRMNFGYVYTSYPQPEGIEIRATMSTSSPIYYAGTQELDQFYLRIRNMHGEIMWEQPIDQNIDEIFFIEKQFLSFEMVVSIENEDSTTLIAQQTGVLVSPIVAITYYKKTLDSDWTIAISSNKKDSLYIQGEVRIYSQDELIFTIPAHEWKDSLSFTFKTPLDPTTLQVEIDLTYGTIHGWGEQTRHIERCPLIKGTYYLNEIQLD